MFGGGFRQAGIIAAGATLASQDVNFCLVPEVPFTLPGFLDALRRRLERRAHAVVVVAEGTGQKMLQAGQERGREVVRRGRAQQIHQQLAAVAKACGRVVCTC